MCDACTWYASLTEDIKSQIDSKKMFQNKCGDAKLFCMVIWWKMQDQITKLMEYSKVITPINGIATISKYCGSKAEY